MMPREEISAAELERAYERVTADSCYIFKEDSLELLIRAKDERVWRICEKMLAGSDDDWLIAGRALRMLGGQRAIRLLLDEIQKAVELDQIPWIIPFYNWVGEIITKRHVKRFKELLEGVTSGFQCHLSGRTWNDVGKHALSEVSWRNG